MRFGWTLPRCLSLALLVGAAGCATVARAGGPHNPHELAFAPRPPPPAPPAQPPPEPQVAVLHDTSIEITETVQFEYDSDQLQSVSDHVLGQVAALLRAHPEIRRVRVEGNTDSRGSESHNQDLSTRRAGTVAEYLRAHGVPTQIESMGHGASRPLCRDNNEDCWARNRRVEFVITERTPAAGATAASTGPRPESSDRAQGAH